MSGEERFRLIYAAGGRGDDLEQQRLIQTGQKITFTMSDHAPAAHAFSELSLLTYIELSDDASRYLEALSLSDTAGATEALTDTEDEDEELKAMASEDDEPAESTDEAETEAEDERRKSPADRAMDVALALGCLFREKLNGWILFCERMTVPPFSLWKGLPGFDRLERAQKLAEIVAFTREGLQLWIKRTKPPGTDEADDPVISAERAADGCDWIFRNRLVWWGGA